MMSTAPGSSGIGLGHVYRPGPSGFQELLMRTSDRSITSRQWTIKSARRHCGESDGEKFYERVSSGSRFAHDFQKLPRALSDHFVAIFPQGFGVNQIRANAQRQRPGLNEISGGLQRNTSRGNEFNLR